MIRVLLTVLLAVFWTSCSKKDEAGAAAGGDKVFVFTAIPDQNATDLDKRYAAITKYFEAKLGVKVKYAAQKDYAASVTAFKNNDVQLAWFGGYTGVQARLAVPGSNAIAQGAEDPKYKSYFIANSSTGLKESDKFPDIKGKTFTFGSKSSTSGRLMPQYFISKETGKTPEEFFSKVGFSGDHSKTITLVESGSYEVGVLSYTVWEKAVKEKKVDTSKVSLIWKTPDYPDYNWTIRGDVDKQFGEGFAAKVKQALLDLEDVEILGHFNRSKFINAENEMFTPILDTAKALKMID
ncbi:MAG: putative selenate ABC transporter substrate-binding protein [Lentisphaeraceae bacterium]|nr:putative selenate ABC transporter substrate-binding protein [Lentisphaeraceae bacterium]